MNKKLFIIIIIASFILSSCNNREKNALAREDNFVSDSVNCCSITIKEPETYLTAFAIKEYCKLFEEPDIKSKVVSELYYGRRLDIIAQVNSFYSIKFDKKVVFINCDDVAFIEPNDCKLLFSNLETKGEAFIEGVPAISQFPDFPTGCEAVSTVMALNYLGEDISVSEFVDNYLPKSNSFYFKNGELYGPDPTDVYVGDPRTVSSFGCMSAPIEKALLDYIDDKSRIKRYEGVKLENLCAKYIDHGIPVLVWATIAMIPSYGSAKWKTDDNETYIWLANEHCMLMVGYDSNYYYMNDPYKGKLIAYPKDKTEIRYKELGYQAIVIER